MVKQTQEKGDQFVKDALLDYFAPAGRAKKALDQWIHNCQIIENNYQGDLRKYFARYGNDAPSIVDALVVAPRTKSKYKDSVAMV